MPDLTSLKAVVLGISPDPPAKQKKIANQLQAIFLDEFPFVPLFIGPRWSTYSTKYFDGWVTWKNQYVDPIFSTGQQVEKQLLSLRPVKK